MLPDENTTFYSENATGEIRVGQWVVGAISPNPALFQRSNAAMKTELITVQNHGSFFVVFSPLKQMVKKSKAKWSMYGFSGGFEIN